MKRLYCGMAYQYRKNRLMVTLQAFVDDSGDESTFALGGFIAPIKVWDEICVEWTAICQETPQIGYYRTNEALGLKECFKKMDQGQRNQKIARLAMAIPIKDCYGIAVHLSKALLKEIIDHYPIASPLRFPFNFPYYDHSCPK